MLDRTREIAHQSLGEYLAEAAYEEGRAMPLDGAISLAFAMLAAILEGGQAAVDRP